MWKFEHTFEPRRTVLLLGRGRQAESVMPSATEIERTTCISSNEYICKREKSSNFEFSHFQTFALSANLIKIVQACKVH